MRSRALVAWGVLATLSRAATVPAVDIDTDAKTKTVTNTNTNSNSGAVSVTITPAVSSEDGDTEGPNDAVAKAWPCEVRSWVRAPDLAPSGTFPAHARLALNGSACGDVVGWQVGLRFKERAVIKKKSSNADFPVRPEWNSSRCRSSVDWNDIYLVNGGIRDMDDYGKQMDEYNKALQDPRLWEVHGAERNVFDVVQDLPFDNSGDKTVVDTIVPFFVHVPDVNLPPVEERAYIGYNTGSDGQVRNAESRFEYYHLLRLANGTVLDIPAGQSGFLPSGTSLANERQAITAWPEMVYFESPRNETSRASNDPQDWIKYGRTAPACDDNALAKFEMQITSPYAPLVQGENSTLHVRITRTGNGTEYPAFLDVRQTTQRNVTWAYQYLQSESEYDDVSGSVMGPHRHRWMQGGRDMARMLLIKPLSVLEKEREESSKAARGTMCTSFEGGMPWNHGAFRHDFSFEKGSNESYDVDVDVATPYNALPTYDATFEAIKANLVFSLHTKFRCEVDEADTAARQALGSRDPLAARDAEWDEYKLPERSQHRNHMTSSHNVAVPVEVHLSAENSGGEALALASATAKPYLDPEALGPVLSTSSARPASFPKLGSELREESAEEMRKSRFGRFDDQRRQKGRQNGQARLWDGNGGGGWAHAAKLWQSYLERSRVDEKPAGLVIQA